MLTEAQKKDIQGAYRAYLGGRGLKPRTGQRQMIAHIARRLSDRDSDSLPVAVVEAGTGTGKTVGYLIPAIVLAKAEKKQVVLSTATVALQGQLTDKDIPELLEHGGLEFSVALGKGRGRFYCPVKAEKSRHELTAEDTLFQQAEGRAAYVREQLEALQSRFDADWSGDMDALEEQPGADLRRSVTATSSDCLGPRCPSYNDCPYYRHRAEWDRVDVLVVNHDLVLSDLSLGGGVVLPDPESTLYLFDEAHHLPEKALQHFARELDCQVVGRFLDGLPRHANRCVTELQAYDALAESLSDIEFQAREARDRLRRVEQWLPQLDWPSPDGRRRLAWVRFPLGSIPEPLMVDLIELDLQFKPILAFFARVQKVIDADLKQAHPAAGQTALQSWSQQVGQDVELILGVQALINEYREADGAQPVTHWVEQPEAGKYVMMSSPFLAGNLLNRALWHRCWGAVMTSATLSAGGDFSRFQAQTGLRDGALYMRVESPFDFHRQAQLWIPDDAVNASAADAHTADLIARLPGLLSDHPATLVLFASRAQMEAVAAGLPRAVRATVQCQGERSREAIVAAHRDRLAQRQPSAIFGLASFSEGIDLPGEALTQVIIAKLPFSVPDDPLQAGATEWIERSGGHPFMQLTLPEAIIRLTQAVGRLIRHEADEGRVVILDNRVRTARYGERIVRALPAFRGQHDAA